MFDLSICIVNWNVKELLNACLVSIYKNTKDISFEVIVVDNNSSDDSVQMVKKDFPQVKLIANKTNAGFTKANNQAIKISQGRYIMLLNPDTEVTDNAMNKMIKFMESRRDCGALGCKLLNTDGTLQRSCRTFPSLEVMLYNALFLDSLLPKSRIFGKYFMTWWDFNETREVDQPMGSALMIKKEVLAKVGLFDENIFIWFDEVDLCYRIKKAGWKIYFTPDIQIKHHLSRSFKQWKSFPQIIKGAVIWRKSRNYFFRKHKGMLSVSVLLALDILQVAIIISVLYTIAKIVLRGF
ncbi:MAG: glycosyltransferase family 2 protein [bacterium]